MSFAIYMNAPTILAIVLVCQMFLWTTFLIYDLHRRPNAPSLFSSLRLYCHIIPAFSFFITSITAQNVEDHALVWFVAVLVFRYWRTIVNIFFWFRYKPALATGDEKITAKECTVIVPTVGPKDNSMFADMVAGILINEPARLVFSTNTTDTTEQLETYLAGLLHNLKAGMTTYQKQWALGPVEVNTEISVNNAKISNKRKQVVDAFGKVDTKILVMADDTAVWHPKFLAATLPAFGNEKVGFVGTRKWVKHLPRVTDPTAGFLKNIWLYYWSGFWNVMGGIYLIRHNFEIRATNAADGGVFCVSGRSSLIRTEIVKNDAFTHAFLNEYVLRLGDWFPGWGPVAADDDNFITRYVINHGWDIKIQYSEESTITTTLGQFPLKFPEQCKRWSRTTFRQNPIALFTDRTIWWKWPLTVWTTYFPWLYNAALFWDSLAIYMLSQTKMYEKSANPAAIMCCLVGFIWVTKLVKTLPWFWEYPMDFLLYFVIPAYPLFAYYHSLLKVWTAFTFWDLAWSGRKLPKRVE